MSDQQINEIDLGKIQDPVFRVKLPAAAGQEPAIYDYEPFSLIESLEAIDANAPASIVRGAIATATDPATAPPAKGESFFAEIRRLFQIPGLTAHQCLLLLIGLKNAIAEAKVTKEMEAMNAKDDPRDAPTSG